MSVAQLVRGVGRGLFAVVLVGCASSPEDQAVKDTKAYVDSELLALKEAATALQDAAPSVAWSADSDATAVADMRAAWTEARASYERIEGAIAVLFPDLDAATDERYDGFLAEVADTNLFDGEGVTGVHAIERILWADEHPAAVVAFESALTGYAAAAYPSTAEQALAFKQELCGRLVADLTTMSDDFAPLALDPAAAFGGVIGSLGEQVEKVSLGATGEDESRYAGNTLADMRSNGEGAKAIFDTFRPWLRSVDGEALEAEIDAGFERLAAATELAGDALPTVPATWDPVSPSEADLATPYGKLWVAVDAEADAGSDTSLVHAMEEAAALMEIPVVL